jgi:hypothetical protein
MKPPRPSARLRRRRCWRCRPRRPASWRPAAACPAARPAAREALSARPRGCWYSAMLCARSGRAARRARPASAPRVGHVDQSGRAGAPARSPACQARQRGRRWSSSRSNGLPAAACACQGSARRRPWRHSPLMATARARARRGVVQVVHRALHGGHRLGRFGGHHLVDDPAAVLLGQVGSSGGPGSARRRSRAGSRLRPAASGSAPNSA